MVTDEERERARRRTAVMLEDAGVVLTEEEKGDIEIVDYGFDDLETVGTEIVTYVNTERYCAKELVLFANQTCPEHRHPPFEDYPGKQETFRCRAGEVFLFVEGDSTKDPSVSPPDREEHYTAGREIHLTPGEQFTIPPDTNHWFKAGDSGTIVSEFSSKSVDERDMFTDPAVDRMSNLNY